jgi:hypothetical protein
VPQPLDLLVDRRILFDVGIARWHIGLGLVIVVVGDEVLDRIGGKELLELVAELSGERLVRGDHQSGFLDLLERPRQRGGFSSPRRP